VHISPDLLRQYRDIDQKAGEICTAQVILQPTIPKPDRLLECCRIFCVSSKRTHYLFNNLIKGAATKIKLKKYF